MSTVPSWQEFRDEILRQARSELQALSESPGGAFSPVRRGESLWLPPRNWEDFKESTRTRATKRKAAIFFFFKAVQEGRTKEIAKALAMRAWEYLFGKKCNELTIRNWVNRIESRGGFEFAPMEAYCDGKSRPHKKAQLVARLPAKLGLTNGQFEALANEIKRRSIICDEDLTLVFMSLERDWLMHDEIPGLGIRQNGAAFPLTKQQVRAIAVEPPAQPERCLTTL
jgi:hypothetical protein